MSEKVSQAIYTALRDDSEATNGIRALLGNTTTTPYNVFYKSPPAQFDFTPASGSAQSLLIYNEVASIGDLTIRPKTVQLLEEEYDVQAWSRSLTQLDAIMRRVKLRLNGLRNVTLPTSQNDLHQIKFQSMTSAIFDEAWQVYWRTARFLAWSRDDVLY